MKKTTARTNSKNSRSTFIIILVVGIIAALALGIYLKKRMESKPTQVDLSAAYDPKLDPADFTTTINNKYFTVKPGEKLNYEAQTPKGLETVVITIDGTTKQIAGFNTLVYHDQVFLNGTPVEDTHDYLAQQKSTGDVWYFGEEVNNYENGQLKDHHGTFLHGTDGAKAGIWIKANQKVGDSYRQEYYKGKAEDMVNVVAVNQTVQTKRTTYTGCVKLYAWTPIEDDKEYKYNCPQVSAEVLVQDLTENKRIELTSIMWNKP
jgi:hypothetical protein